MTLVELLGKTPFNEIALYIPKYAHSENNLASYKMHYDLLRSLNHKKKSTSSPILVTYYNKEESNEILEAIHLEGKPWEDIIDCEIKTDSNVNATDAEIAACCLWHTSFFGFIEEQREAFISGLYDRIYDTQFKKYYSKYRTILPSRKELLKIPAIHNQIRHEMELHRSYRANREDKMVKILYMKRSWRKWKRYEINKMYRDRVKSIGRFLNLLSSNDNASILFRASKYSFQVMRTYVTDVEKRQCYLKELIERYKAIRCTLFHECIICISYSETHPLKSIDELSRLFINNLNINNIEFACRKDETLGLNLKVDIMFYER